MFIESFKVTFSAAAQIFVVVAIGFFLVRKGILKGEGLDAVSRLVIEVTLPLLIFSQLAKDFSFTIYQNWWIFPLLSLAITLAGLVLGGIFCVFIKAGQYRLQFVNLVTFQNSGYMPLALAAALLPKEKADIMFIYIFLFLLGFNLVMWSLGVYALTFTRLKKFELGSIFSPPVIAAIAGLVLIALGAQKFIPPTLLKPLKMFGGCTLPLALLVVGGNLAQIKPGRINKGAVMLAALAKLVILPLLGLTVILKLKLPELLGLLLLIELAAPSAMSLSMIIRHYKKEDLLISQGILASHALSLITIPLFLSLYFTLSVVK